MTDDYTLLIRREDMPAEADFCFVAEDDFMEPYIHPGDTVYVSRKSPADMQAGLFYIKGRVLCRQCCEDYAGSLHLLCTNPLRESENLSLNRKEKAECLCLGTVLPARTLPMPVYTKPSKAKKPRGK